MVSNVWRPYLLKSSNAYGMFISLYTKCGLYQILPKYIAPLNYLLRDFESGGYVGK